MLETSSDVHSHAEQFWKIHTYGKKKQNTMPAFFMRLILVVVIIIMKSAKKWGRAAKLQAHCNSCSNRSLNMIFAISFITSGKIIEFF
jgi:hypothetical protein